MNDRYVRIESWHIIRTWTRVPGVVLTLCGRRVSTIPEHATGEEGEERGDTGDRIPGGEKSCESCLRLDQPQEEKPKRRK